MRPLLLIIAIALASCGGDREGASKSSASRYPLSVRGWVTDVKGAQAGASPEVELARRQQLFQSIAMWVEDAPYVTGGVAENGAFVILDVPHSAIIGFNAPGAETARIVLQDIPAGADVFIPDVVLEPDGATVLDPSKILIRVAARVPQPVRTGQTAKVAGYDVPVIQTPYSQMSDRRDFPNPGGFRPVATYR